MHMYLLHLTSEDTKPYMRFTSMHSHCLQSGLKPDFFVCSDMLRPHTVNLMSDKSLLCLFNIDGTFTRWWFTLQISNTQLFLVLRWYFKFVGLYLKETILEKRARKCCTLLD